MKQHLAAIGLLLLLVTTTKAQFLPKFSDEVEPADIWEEATEDAYISICKDPETRLADESNSQDTFIKYLRSQYAFEDTTFQADMNSIFSPNPYHQSPPPPKYNFTRDSKRDIAEWKRILDFDSKATLLGDRSELSPTSTKQGYLGDCWFMATVAALADDVTRLDRTMDVNCRCTLNGHGIYRYYFWNYDKWVAINIDDKMPVKIWNNSLSLYYAQKSMTGAYWVPLFEKAYAKFMGNYDRIHGGWGFEALRQLTNMPVYELGHIKALSDAKSFQKFQKLHRGRHPMVSSCCRLNYGEQAPDGLVNGHVYSLLDIVDVNGYQLVKLRNPWSHDPYYGKFSDQDPIWTADMLAEADHVLNVNDGIFYMPFKQFLSRQYFISTSVAIYKDYLRPQLYTVKQEVKTLNIRIDVPKNQEIYITMEVKHPRLEKFCKNSNTQIHAYLFKGENFPGKQNLIGPIGVIKNYFYHVTMGDPMNYPMYLDKTLYTLQVVNWRFDANNPVPVNYSLTVYRTSNEPVNVHT